MERRTHAQKVNNLTALLKENLSAKGLKSQNEDFFDTLVIETGSHTKQFI